MSGIYCGCGEAGRATPDTIHAASLDDPSLSRLGIAICTRDGPYGLKLPTELTLFKTMPA